MRQNTVRLPHIKLSFSFIDLGAIPRPFSKRLLTFYYKSMSFFVSFFFSTSVSS